MPELLDGPMLLDRGASSLAGGRSVFKNTPLACFFWICKMESSRVHSAKQNEVWNSFITVEPEQ